MSDYRELSISLLEKNDLLDERIKELETEVQDEKDKRFELEMALESILKFSQKYLEVVRR